MLQSAVSQLLEPWKAIFDLMGVDLIVSI